jgi:hypothetical protein
MPVLVIANLVVEIIFIVYWEKLFMQGLKDTSEIKDEGVTHRPASFKEITFKGPKSSICTRR